MCKFSLACTIHLLERTKEQTCRRSTSKSIQSGASGSQRRAASLPPASARPAARAFCCLQRRLGTPRQGRRGKGPAGAGVPEPHVRAGVAVAAVPAPPACSEGAGAATPASLLAPGLPGPPRPHPCPS